ncbi:MAG: NrpR regulatory domain-containing protein [Phycisphaerae bacterium]|nr:NrpR regulatory domain-containing protein [Phycisphaerae bacterium]
MMNKKKLKILEILKIMSKENMPVNSIKLTEDLNNSGYDFSERTVRLYFKEMDQEGLTLSHGKRGRSITEKGLAELHNSRTLQRVGYLSAKIDQMTYKMNFDLPTLTGSVVINTSIVEPKHVMDYCDSICQVFEKGYAMGTLLSLLGPGEKIADTTVPEGMIGFCTVCSVTLNGVLLKHGIPMTSRFGGIIDLVDGTPTRFAEIIHYNGTSIDPLEVFILSSMTNYIGAIADGNGRIGASFRELPAGSRELVLHLANRLKNIGLGAFMRIGMPGKPLLDIPVNEECIGAVVIGGLNPISILVESGIKTKSRALSGLLEYNRLLHYTELPEQIKQYL